METNDYTPGPWSVDDCEDAGHGISVIGADGMTVARCTTPYCNGRNMHRPERDANARLIAAAPDMLATLEYILAYTPGLCSPETATQGASVAVIKGRLKIAHDLAQAAVAKAKGWAPEAD